MPLLPAALLVLGLGFLAWSTYRSIGSYAAFKALADTEARQRHYRNRLLRALAFFGGGALAVLAALGQLGAVLAPPPAFAPLIGSLGGSETLRELSPLLLGGAVAGLVIGVVARVVLAQRRRMGGRGPLQVGDVAALMPRNGAETVWTALLSVNAGVSEELFFRLALPLLLALVIHNAWAAFALAALVFGLAHLYQGWAGVMATTVLGLALTVLYLASGNLAVAMIAHAAIDLYALVLRPSLSRMAARPG